MTDRERGRKSAGPPTTTPRGGPHPATPLSTTFAIAEMSGDQPAPSLTERNYQEPTSGEPRLQDNHPDTTLTDEEDDKHEETPQPGPSSSNKGKEGPPGTTKIRDGVYEIGLNRYIDSTIPALVQDKAREQRQSYLQARITTEGLTKRDRKILRLDTMEAIQEQLAIMQTLVGEETAFEALEKTYSGIQKARGYEVDLYRTSQRPSRANSQVRTPASSRPTSPTYVRVGSPMVLATYQPNPPRKGGGGPTGPTGTTLQVKTPNPANLAQFQLGIWSDNNRRFNISLHPGSGPTNSPKVAKPEKYNGIKKGSKAKRFIDQTENYFHFKAHKFRSDADCIAWTMQYLTGNAYNWFAPYWKKRNDILSHPGEITRWAAFRKTFFITFGEYHQKEKAEEKIKQLKQRGNAARYTADFNNLRSMIRWNLEALKSHYIQGLKPDVLKFASTQPWPDSLEGIQEQAIRIDDVLFQAKNRERDGPPPNTYRTPRTTTAPTGNRPFQPKPTSSFTPRPTNTQKLPPRGRLSEAEQAERKKLGLCNYSRAAELAHTDNESTIEPFETPGNSQSQ